VAFSQPKAGTWSYRYFNYFGPWNRREVFIHRLEIRSIFRLDSDPGLDLFQLSTINKIDKLIRNSSMKHKKFTKPFSIVEQIHKSLSDAILNQELQPGTPLTEIELQEWFGVSRAPIREAIRLLESEGLVVVNAFKKKYVRKLTHEELQEIYTVLGCLEGFAAGIAASRLTAEQLGKLGENIEQMKEEYGKGNIASCTQLNFEFHSSIIRTADNSVLKKTIASIMRAPGWYWLTRAYYRDPVLVLSSVTDHSEILSALRARDSQRADKCVRDHFSNIRSNWKDQM